MKRTLLLLLFAANAAAQGFSVDFTAPEFSGAEADYIHPTVRASGAFTEPVLVSFSYKFPYRQPAQGGVRTVTPGDPLATLEVFVPDDHYYSGPFEGEVSITYYPPGSSQPVTKTAGLNIADNDPAPTVIFGDARMVERGNNIYSVGFRTTTIASVSIPINITVAGGTATAGVDFDILDNPYHLPPWHMEGEIRIRAIDDGLDEGEEYFYISCMARCDQGTVVIEDDYPQAYMSPDETTVMSGELFDVTVVIPQAQTMVLGVEVSNSAAVMQLFRGSPLVRIDPGHNTATIAFRALESGDATITVTFPSGSHLEPVTAQVHVFGGEFSIDRDSVTLAEKEQTEVRVRLDPPPPQSVALTIFADPKIVTAPPVVYIETDGYGSFPITGRALGKTLIELRTATDRLALSLDVQVTPALTVTGIAPASGSTNGGTPVAISGKGFKGTCTATFGTAAATTITVINETTLRAITPAHAAGVTDVKVTCDGNQGTLPGAFTFVKPSRARSVRH
jgi:IPT/TIG domain